MSLLDKLRGLVGAKPVDLDVAREAATRTSAVQPPAKANIKEPEADLAIEITEDYRAVITAIENKESVVFVSGSAGTGKTTLIKYLMHKYAGGVVVVAPTGVAALQVGGVTINSFFKLPPRIIFPETDIKKLFDRKLYASIRLLIIDEISMVRADTLDAINEFLKLNGPQEGIDFGGVQLLLVGDLFQLPPVVTSEDMKVLISREYKSPFFFAAQSLYKKHMVMVELQKVFRQKEASFSKLLSHLRLNDDTENVINEFNSQCYKEGADSNPDAITVTTTNNKADLINSTELKNLAGPLFTYTGVIEGKFNVDEKNLPSPMNLAIKVGSQVMFTANSPSMPRKWVNGTLGKVKEITFGSVLVEIEKDNQTITVDVPKFEWKSYAYKLNPDTQKIEPVEIGVYRQVPLMLAWAVTIHKSQGKTIDKINVDLSHGAFASGQTYVALSRCPTIDGISLARPIKLSDVKCDAEIIRFYEAVTS
jgi:ATP-dependent exoDNAse (exonuclease V) alpha subunit